MSNFRLALVVMTVAGGGLGFSSSVLAQGTTASNKALEARLEALDRKVKALEQQLQQERAKAAVQAQPVPPPVVKEEQYEALDQKVRILERRWELEQVAANKAKEGPIVGAGKDGFF